MKIPTIPRRPSATSALALALLVAGCDGVADPFERGGQVGGGLGLAPPGVLAQSRAVDRSRLRPSVSIVGGAEVPMSPVGDRWRGTVDVVPGRDYALEIVWIEEIDSGERVRDLPLARLERTVSVGAEGETFTVGADEYDLELDFDGDGTSNLAEREADTDPFGDEAPRDDSPAADGDDPVTGADDEGNDPVDPPVVRPDDDEEPLEEPPADTPVPDVPAVVDTPPAEPDAPAPDDGPLEPEPVEEPPVVPDTEPDAEPDVDPVPTEPVETVPPAAEVDVIVPRIAPTDAPGIDGLDVVRRADGIWDGEWAGATSFDARGDRLFIDRLMVDNGTDEVNGQAFRSWSAMHDGEYLYVLVVVDDDGRRVRDSEEVWRDDSLEVYVDGDNSRNSTYVDGDDDDSSRLIPLVEPGTTRRGTTDGLVSGFLSADAPIRIDFATGPGIGPDGLRRPRFEQDVYELRIELESAGIVPGRPFGFELQVNDDDDGGNREAKWGWAHPARTDVDIDFTFLDPSFMGTAVLE